MSATTDVAAAAASAPFWPCIQCAAFEAILSSADDDEEKNALAPWILRHNNDPNAFCLAPKDPEQRNFEAWLHLMRADIVNTVGRLGENDHDLLHPAVKQLIRCSENFDTLRDDLYKLATDNPSLEIDIKSETVSYTKKNDDNDDSEKKTKFQLTPSQRALYRFVMTLLNALNKLDQHQPIAETKEITLNVFFNENEAASQ